MEMTNENSEPTQHQVQKLISDKIQLNNVNIFSALGVEKYASVYCKVACFLRGREGGQHVALHLSYFDQYMMSNCF